MAVTSPPIQRVFEPHPRKARNQMAICPPRPFPSPPKRVGSVPTVVAWPTHPPTISREQWNQQEAEREVDAMLQGKKYQYRPFPGKPQEANTL